MTLKVKVVPVLTVVAGTLNDPSDCVGTVVLKDPPLTVTWTPPPMDCAPGLPGVVIITWPEKLTFCEPSSIVPWLGVALTAVVACTAEIWTVWLAAVYRVLAATLKLKEVLAVSPLAV